MTKQSNLRNFSIIAHIDRVGAKSAWPRSLAHLVLRASLREAGLKTRLRAQSFPRKILDFAGPPFLI